MSLQQRLLAQLKAARGFTEQLLGGFTSPEEWTHQVHERANHALWFAGHMGVADNFFISVLDKGRARPLPAFEEKFGMGSQPTNSPLAYPPLDEVLAYMRDRRATLLAILEKLTDDDLALPTPPGSPEFLRDKAGVFETAIWHEGLHSGQVSVAHRGLGRNPVFSAGE